MALHINLYHEIQTQSLQRKRDPFRVGLVVILFVAACLLGYYFYRLEGSSEINEKAAKLQNEWRILGPQRDQAAAREAELRVSAKLSETLLQRIEGRCLWGAILDLIGQSVPAQVQIKNIDASKPSASKQISFTLSGIASGPEARKAAEDFRVAFAQKLSLKFKNVSIIPRDGFKSLEDREETVTLNGQTYPTAAFVVSYEASLDSGPDAAPAPTPRTRRNIP